MDYFQLLKMQGEKYLSKPFLILDRITYSYETTLEQSESLRLGLQDHLPNSHQVIFIYSRSVSFQLLVFFAVQASGNIPIISPYPLPNQTFIQLLAKNQISYVMTQKEENLPFPFIKMRQNILLYHTGFLNSKCLDPNICMGVLTSGSTGVPKILFRTYESWAGFFPTQNKIFKVDSDTSFFMNGSLSFTGNLNFVFSILYAGGTILSITSLNVKAWVWAIENYHATHIYLIPTKLKEFRLLKNEPMQSVRIVLTGSQILQTDLVKSLSYFFPNSETIEYYGASELNYVTYLYGKELFQHPQSVGRPFPGIHVFVEKGFIYVDTKYHTAGLESPCTVHDMGHFDTSGYLIFDGRKDSIVNCGGYKVNTAKVEQALLHIDAVEEASVVCQKDVLRGNCIHAFITVAHPVSAGWIRSHLKDSLKTQELPRKITILDHFPFNASGKIDKNKLL